jgi:hypothetical protein
MARVRREADKPWFSRDGIARDVIFFMGTDLCWPPEKLPSIDELLMAME